MPTKEELQQQLADIARQEKEDLKIRNLEFAKQYQDVKYLLESVFRDTYTCYTLLFVKGVEPQLNNDTYAVYIKGDGVRLTLETKSKYERCNMYDSTDMSVSLGEYNKAEVTILTKKQYDMLFEEYKNIVASYEKQFSHFLDCLSNDNN